MRCVWCGRELGKDHGYSETGEPICASYSATPNKAYSACKARAHRLRQKEAKGLSSRDVSEKREIEASSAVVEGLQMLISLAEESNANQRRLIAQNDEIIANQRQQPKQVVTETKVISTTTFEAPEDMDFDIEIKQDKSTKSATTFIDQMKAMQAGEGVWAKKDMKQ